MVKQALPPQTTHKTWAAAGGALLGNMVLTGILVLTRYLFDQPIQLDPDSVAAIYTLTTAIVTSAGAMVGAGLSAYYKRNYRK